MSEPTGIISQIQDYLSNGGLFNPEQMEEWMVRDLIIDCRTHILTIQRERDEARLLATRGAEALAQLMPKLKLAELRLDRAAEALFELSCYEDTAGEIATKARDEIVKMRITP